MDKYDTITYQQAIGVIDAGAVLIDVREDDEYSAGTIPGAVNIPLSEFTQSKQKIEQYTDILLFCRSGRRSEKAAKVLCNWTEKKFFCLDGGYKAYLEYINNQGK